LNPRELEMIKNDEVKLILPRIFGPIWANKRFGATWADYRHLDVPTFSMLDCQCHLHMLQRDNAMQGSITLTHGSVKPQKVVCSDFFVVTDCLFWDQFSAIF